MSWVSLASAAIAGAILLVHLLRRRPVTPFVKVWLLLALGIFPIVTAGTANIAGFEATQSRNFCGSCHVMTPYADDSVNPRSFTLAAVHGRNDSFGKKNCYTCHEDYGMYGFVLTKMGGMRHVYLYLKDFRNMPLAQSEREIRIMKPLPNANCMHCHTTEAPTWLAIPDHVSSLASVRAGTVSCASAGCHGYAHPTTKVAP